MCWKCCFGSGPCCCVRRHYRRQLLETIPTEVNKNNIQSIINRDYIQSWKMYSNPIKSQMEWQSLSYKLDIYWWLFATLIILMTLFIHILKLILYEYTTYTNSDNIALTSCEAFGSPFSQLCTITLHIYQVPVIGIWLSNCYYGLTKWTHIDSNIIYSKLHFNNISIYVFCGLEFIQTLFFNNKDNFNNSSILFRYILLSIWTIIFSIILSFGIYLRFKLSSFNKSQFVDTRLDDIINNKYKIEYPSTEDDIIKLIKRANVENVELRVIGSKHSFAPSIYPDNPTYVISNDDGSNVVTKYGDILVSLDNYRRVVDIDKKEMRITVQAGMLLGKNERLKWSKWENGLAHHIDQLGWALGCVGGIIKQSVGGFTVKFRCCCIELYNLYCVHFPVFVLESFLFFYFFIFYFLDLKLLHFCFLLLLSTVL